MKKQFRVDRLKNMSDYDTYNRLRTRIRFLFPDLKMFTITSHNESDGKTDLALKLAESYARSNHKVLILDADLKNPGFFAYFAEKKQTGSLLEYLTGQSSLADCVIHLNNHLDILTSKPYARSTEIFENETTHSLLQELRSIYDVIIIDTPALSRSIDASLLTEQADGTLYVIRAHSTSEKLINKDIELIQEIQKPIIGCVMTSA